MGITLWQYYENAAARIADSAFQGVATLKDWQARRKAIHREFMDSLGLEPLPATGALKLTDYGEFKGRGYRGRKISYPLMPDCWASGTVYYPDPLTERKAPAVLYCCGHQGVGSVRFQGHAIMWARRGYICLIFDTIEQHDNLGNHHGTYLKERYDWLSMGYSGAGGELWNTMRAFEALLAIPEVDPRRVGVTGISGGGALSYFLAAADERVAAVASVCGVASPALTISNRHVQGHCDCIYYQNLHRRDSSEFAALIAPRPALFCFALQDSLFSRDEWRPFVSKTRKIYRLNGCPGKCALREFPGHHAYHPGAVAAINDWFDTHVAREKHPPLPLQKPEQPEKTITLFNGKPPAEQRIYLLPELLSPRGLVPLPEGPADWPAIRKKALIQLRARIYRPLDGLGEKLRMRRVGDWLSGSPKRPHQAWRGTIGGMDVWVELHGPNEKYGEPKNVFVALAGPGETARDAYFRVFYAVEGHTVVAVEPRGTGMTGVPDSLEWDFLRAGALIGVTPVTLLIQDLRLIMPFILRLPLVRGKKVFLYGHGDGGAACLYHTLFDNRITGVVTEGIPNSHRNGAYVPAILRLLDIDHLAGLVAPRLVGLVNQPGSRNMWTTRLLERLRLPRQTVFGGRSLKSAVDGMLGAADDPGK